MDPIIIGPIQKDKVLALLCTHTTPEQFNRWDITALLKELAISFDELKAILTFFERIGFVAELNLRGNTGHWIVRVEANDYYLRGGFAFHEDILEQNIKKLLLEIENLNKQLAPNHLETANKLSTIASTILTGISLIKT